MKRETRVAGALMGFAAGDALGATTEFMTPQDIRKYLGRHDSIVGGGVLGWRAGEGTDDSDTMFALASVYAEGYTLKSAADALLAWLQTDPKDVGGTTNAALKHYAEFGDEYACGPAVVTKMAAGNGSLMWSLATGLVVRDPVLRARRAAQLSAITHADKRCIDACIAYTDIVAHLIEGVSPREAIDRAARALPYDSLVRKILRRAPSRRLKNLRTSGYVLDTLEVAVWAICQEDSLENLLIKIVNRGDDADTVAAVAGGLLGARDGVRAIPNRWCSPLEYEETAVRLAERLVPDETTCTERQLTWHGSYATEGRALEAAWEDIGTATIGFNHERDMWQLLNVR